MPSTCRRSTPAEPARAGFMAIIAIIALVVGCGGAASSSDAPDDAVHGPQGDVGQFVVECEPSHLLHDDPIVRPDAPGSSHLHQFFGAVEAATGATPAQLSGGETTCALPADTASYWTPALLSGGGEVVEPIGMIGYYRAGPGVDPTSIVAYPPGFMMVAGDHDATGPQDLAVVAWSCGPSTAIAPRPPDCAGTESLRLSVTFPDCWDGERRRSAIPLEPSLHVAYSSDGACPTSHPVSIPQLRLAVDYPPNTAAPDDLTLASGDIVTGHADFWNTWDQSKLEREVAACLHRDLVCGVSS